MGELLEHADEGVKTENKKLKKKHLMVNLHIHNLSSKQNEK